MQTDDMTQSHDGGELLGRGADGMTEAPFQSALAETEAAGKRSDAYHTESPVNVRKSGNNESIGIAVA